MQTIIKSTTLIFIVLLLACNNDKQAGKSLKIEDRILDRADLLTKSQEDSVFSLIKNLEQEIGSQIAVLTIDSLGGQKIEEYSLQMTENLGLGRSTHNDGVLITISVKDRKVRVEVGTGLENIIKDEIAARIIKQEIVAGFRKEKYGLGLYNAVNKICKLIEAHKDLVGTDPL
jgi:uncharacterized protein